MCRFIKLNCRFLLIMRSITILYLSFIVLPSQAQSITVFRAKESVAITSKKIENIIKEKGLVYFETIAQDEIANQRGVKIDPVRSVLFEDADLCTKLVACQPTVSLDLPLKILVWEEHGDVFIGYMDPNQMKRRFLIAGCDDILSKLTGLHVRIINEALREN